MISCNLSPVPTGEVVAITRLKALGRVGFFFSGNIKLKKVVHRGSAVGDQYVAIREIDGEGRLVSIDLERYWLDGPPKENKADIEISLNFSTRQ
jgi:hypothetical protein